MTDFGAMVPFLTIQLFAFKAHVFWRPVKDTIYYSGMVLCEFAVAIHGFIFLIFTSEKIAYSTRYTIGYVFHVVILLLFTAMLIIKYFVLAH